MIFIQMRIDETLLILQLALWKYLGLVVAGNQGCLESVGTSVSSMLLIFPFALATKDGILSWNGP
jgi:hypothetical protein